MQKKFITPAIFLLACGLVNADINNTVINGSFENGENGKCPNNWNYDISRNAEASIKITDQSSADGEKAILITNKSQQQPNVFGVLHQTVKLEAGKKYLLSCQAQSTGEAHLQFILGKRWQQRLPLKDLSDKWQNYEFEFTANPEDCEADGKYMIRLCTEGITTTAYVDSISITPAGIQVIDAGKFQEQRIYLLPELNIDLQTVKTMPSGLPKLHIPAGHKFFQGGKMQDRTDLAADIALAATPDGLLFLAEVNDNCRTVWANSEMWRGDCVQLRIDQEGTLNDGDKKSDVEIGFAPAADGVKTWYWQAERPLSDQEATTTAITTPGGYLIAAKLSKSFLNKINFDQRKPFSFNVVINDNDNNQQRKVAFLASGIHDYKSSAHNTMSLFTTDKPMLNCVPTKLKTFKTFSGHLVVSGVNHNAPWSISAIITDAQKKQHEFTIPGNTPIATTQIGKTHFSFPLDKVSEGPFTVSFAVPGTTATAVVNANKSDLGKEQLLTLDKIDRRLATAKEELSRLYANKRISRYAELLLTETTRQAALQRQDLNRKESNEAHTFYIGRGEIVIPELTQSMDMLDEQLQQLRKGGKLPDTWMYISSPAELKNGWFQAEAVNEQGNKEKRDTFFIGYGHFGDVIRDLPLFQKIGSNVIQIEIGPRSFFPKPGKNGDLTDISYDDLQKRIEPAIQRAWENNSKICLLLSPHYMPEWIPEKYPEMKSVSGFLKYEVNQPKSREVIEKYLNIIIPLLKNAKYKEAIHSLCLSNEPTYMTCSLESDFSRRQFQACLEKKYGPVSSFNQATGNNFSDYPAAIAAGMKNPAVKYEFHMYKREAFAEWHRWMADAVRKLWPEIPLSAKIMVFNNLKATRIDEGVDPELFAGLSDLNGNDNYMNYGQSNWISGWVSMAMTHDLQLSMKKTSICNSENHIIKDTETNPIPYDHIYTAIFQQLTQGVGSMMTWVWTDLNYTGHTKTHDLQGNIFRRPADVIAQGMAALDGNRIAPEIVKFAQTDAEVALLYAPTSYILNGEKYCNSIEQLYTNLSFTGYKLGFRSEKQLAAGDLGKTKVIFIPDAANIRRDALEGLRKFNAQGGKIITFGKCMEQDEFGRPLTANLPTTVLPELKSQEMITRMQKLIAEKVKLPLNMTDPNKGNVGLVWKTAVGSDATIVNLVNYNLEPRRIKLTVPTGSRIIDLLAEKEITAEFELKPLKPLLLKIAR